MESKHGRSKRVPSIYTTNKEEVRCRLGIELELFKLIKIRRTSYLSHVFRNKKYRYAILIIKGKIEEKARDKR